MSEILDVEVAEKLVATRLLIMFLGETDDVQRRAVMLSNYVQHYGAVPNDFAPLVMSLISGERKDDADK